MGNLTSRVLPPALGAFLLLAPGDPLDAQVVTGTVVEEDASADARPTLVSVAAVAVLSVEGEAVLTVRADSAGRFRLEVPAPGRYLLEATALGYRASVSDTIAIASGETLDVLLRVSREPLSLPPLTVVTRVDERLERRGFYENRSIYEEKMGFAQFITPEDIERTHAFRVEQLLRTEASMLREVSLGGRRTALVTFDGTRPPLYINGARFRLGPGDNIGDVIALPDILAVEVYWRISPGEYGGGSAIVIWTR